MLKTKSKTSKHTIAKEELCCEQVEEMEESSIHEGEYVVEGKIIRNWTFNGETISSPDNINKEDPLPEVK